MIQVAVAGMILDQQSHAPVLLLHVPPLDKYLPIWIGPSEAASIGMALKQEKFERPLTHDLLVTIIDALEGKVARVHVHDLRDNTFFAKIFLERGQQVIAIDARPSDSIAIAVRTGAPIYIAESLLEKERDHLLSLDPEATRRALAEEENGGPAAGPPGGASAGAADPDDEAPPEAPDDDQPPPGPPEDRAR